MFVVFCFFMPIVDILILLNDTNTEMFKEAGFYFSLINK